MPGPTQDKQAAALANDIITLTQNLHDVGQRIAEVSSQWTDVSVADKLNAFPTAAMLATGELGAADATPDVAHVIDPRTELGALLAISLSANDIAGLLTFLQGINACIGGEAVAANGAAPQLIAKCL